MRGRRHRLRGAADPGRVAAPIPERRRRGGARAWLRLRRRHRCARRDRADPHPAQHQPESELRRRGDGGEPRLREAPARAAAAPWLVCDRRRTRGGARAGRRLPAGRRPCRLPVDGRIDRAPGGAASRAAECPPPRDRAGQRTGGRRPVRRQRCLLRRHRESGGGLLHRSAGPGRRERDVLRSDRGPGRDRPADGARGESGRGRGDGPRDGLVRRLPAARRRRSERQHDTRQQEGRVVEHRREGDGLDREIRLGADRRRARARRAAEDPGTDLCRDAGERLHLRHAAARCGDESSRVHHRARHALRTRRRAGDQGRHAHRSRAALARPDGRERRAHRRRGRRPSRRSAGSCSG